MQKILLIVLLTFIVQPASNGVGYPDYIDLGRFTEDKIARMIKASSLYSSNGERIDFISAHFINVPYMESTLIGNHKNREVLTINLAGLDCFTYLDYVEAIRLSSQYHEFKNNVMRVRYKKGKISYKHRKHFFSDWVNSDTTEIRDVTKIVGGKPVISVVKSLNEKEDGSRYLPQIPMVTREINYIPSDTVSSVADKLKTGDYVGIYSPRSGLDVSHTGIVIKKGDEIYIRHASSINRKGHVVDENLMDYLKGKPGVVVYRTL